MKNLLEINFSSNNNYQSDWIPVFSESWKNSIYKLGSIQINWEDAIANCGNISIELSNDAISYAKFFEYQINTINNESDALIIDIDTIADYIRVSYSKALNNQGRISVILVSRIFQTKK